ncbi:MAG: hypothetical protein AVDCRST_MAG77-5505, partial [uncultured Chloroflexi bacterium]
GAARCQSAPWTWGRPPRRRRPQGHGARLRLLRRVLAWRCCDVAWGEGGAVRGVGV